MGIHCFQLAAPVLRVLDLLGQMGDERVRELRKSFQVSLIVFIFLLFFFFFGGFLTSLGRALRGAQL